MEIKTQKDLVKYLKRERIKYYTKRFFTEPITYLTIAIGVSCLMLYYTGKDKDISTFSKYINVSERHAPKRFRISSLDRLLQLDSNV